MKKKRTFRKFTFRGVDLDALLDKSRLDSFVYFIPKFFSCSFHHHCHPRPVQFVACQNKTDRYILNYFDKNKNKSQIAYELLTQTPLCGVGNIWLVIATCARTIFERKNRRIRSPLVVVGALRCTNASAPTESEWRSQLYCLLFFLLYFLFI